MIRRISSLYTPLMQFLPVPLLSAVIVLALFSIRGQTLPLFPDGVTVLGMALAAVAFFGWYSSRLWFVGVDKDTLYVSGWLKRSTMPLSEIEDVYYSGVGLVHIRLKTRSAAGRTIAFIPTMGAGLLLTLGSRSIVEELRELANKASAPSGDAT
jgi:hypothetical protein